MRLNFDGTAGSLKSILEEGEVVKRWWWGKGGVTDTNLRQRVMLLCADCFHTGLKIIWNHLRLPPPSFASDYVLPWKPRISLSVSKQLHAYSSADKTLNLTCYQSTVVGLGKGEEGRCTVAQILTLIQSLYTYPITPFFSLRCIVKYSLSSPFAFWNRNLFLISYILPPVLYRLTWIS